MTSFSEISKLLCLLTSRYDAPLCERNAKCITSALASFIRYVLWLRGGILGRARETIQDFVCDRNVNTYLMCIDAEQIIKSWGVESTIRLTGSRENKSVSKSSKKSFLFHSSFGVPWKQHVPSFHQCFVSRKSFRVQNACDSKLQDKRVVTYIKSCSIEAWFNCPSRPMINKLIRDDLQNFPQQNAVIPVYNITLSTWNIKRNFSSSEKEIGFFCYLLLYEQEKFFFSRNIEFDVSCTEQTCILNIIYVRLSSDDLSSNPAAKQKGSG